MYMLTYLQNNRFITTASNSIYHILVTGKYLCTCVIVLISGKRL